jgi:CheY-like chemotaxis protein
VQGGAPVDAVLTDVMMPGMDGIELCAQLKEAQPRAEVIVMTAYAELQVTTNFTFLRGASHPEEMAGEAAALGLARAAPGEPAGRRPREGSWPPLSGYREPERGETETGE